MEGAHYASPTVECIKQTPHAPDNKKIKWEIYHEVPRLGLHTVPTAHQETLYDELPSAA